MLMAPSTFPWKSCADVWTSYVRVLATPMVVDFDFDDDPVTFHPSIVFVGTDRTGGGSAECNGNGIIRERNKRNEDMEKVVMALLAEAKGE